MLDYQAIFTDFDYDYTALGNQLGEAWQDSTWKNNTCPCYVTSLNRGERYEVWYTLWFDYKDPAKSEFEAYRHSGEMKQFELSDEVGDVVFSTNSWEEMKKAIEDGAIQKHYDNQQEARASND